MTDRVLLDFDAAVVAITLRPESLTSLDKGMNRRLAKACGWQEDRGARRTAVDSAARSEARRLINKQSEALLHGTKA